MKNSNFNPANLITISRILLVPVFLILIFSEQIVAHIFGYCLYILLAISDKIDGHIARKYNIITPLGQILDPIADKILVFSALFYCSIVTQNIVVILCSLIIVIRETVVTIFRLSVLNKKVIPADKYGKIKTVFQLTSTIYFLTTIPFVYWDFIFYPLIVVTTIITLFSGILVFANYKNHKQES